MHLKDAHIAHLGRLVLHHVKGPPELAGIIRQLRHGGHVDAAGKKAHIGLDGKPQVIFELSVNDKPLLMSFLVVAVIAAPEIMRHLNGDCGYAGKVLPQSS